MNLADMMTRSGTLPPSGSICHGVSKCSGRRIYGAQQPSMGQRPCDAERAPRFKYIGHKYRCGRGNRPPQGLVRSGRGRRVEAQERRQHAVEALGTVADEEFEQTA